MIAEAAFGRLLLLNECWEVLAAAYESKPAPGLFTLLAGSFVPPMTRALLKLVLVGRGY